jgi:hypothetical protein
MAIAATMNKQTCVTNCGPDNAASAIMGQPTWNERYRI